MKNFINLLLRGILWRPINRLKILPRSTPDFTSIFMKINIALQKILNADWNKYTENIKKEDSWKGKK